MVSKMGWNLWYVFLSKDGEKSSIKKRFALNLKTSVWSLFGYLFLQLRKNSFTLLRRFKNKDWFNYSSNSPRVFTVEYTFCLFRPPEHMLVYVFLFTLKYIGSILSKRKDEGFFKKSDFMLRRLAFIQVPASMKSLLPLFCSWKQYYTFIFKKWDSPDTWVICIYLIWITYLHIYVL